MIRAIIGVLSGLFAWVLIATVGNLALRVALPGYAEVEKAMTFSLTMLMARLLLGAVSSLGAGLTVAWITKRSGFSVKVVAGILFLVFLPLHYTLWDKFPIWYHIVFLASLVVMTLLGAMFVSSRAHFVTEG